MSKSARFCLTLLCFTSFILGLCAEARTFKQALPGYQFTFPRDHASHDDYKTEWWYYTGHLATQGGKHFGYELTFFRTGVENSDEQIHSPWSLKNIYFTHFAISDENSHQFFYFEKLNRAGVGAAGARQDTVDVFNEDWSVEQLGENFYLTANTPRFGIHLLLAPLKPPVVHGHDGVSQKASCKGCASHYYSSTRLKTDGNLFIDGKPNKVTGLSWMDHEFGSNQLTEDQVGWDWYSIQLDNNVEVMLYLMRNKTGGIDSNSSGTVVYPDGKSAYLPLSAFHVRPKGQWKSPKSGGTYPMGWDIAIPQLDAAITITPAFEGQELVTTKSTGVTYWEGAASVTGKMGSKSVTGQAYVEMTGYAEKFRKHI